MVFPLKVMIQEIIARTRQYDLVHRVWCITSQEMNVWVDTRSLATDVLLEEKHN